MSETPASKRDLLIETAKDLFFKFGIKRVTVGEICQTAKVSKMTFYKHFRDKADLTKALVLLLFDRKAAAFAGIMALDAPFPEKMKSLVAMRIADARDVSREFMLDLFQSPRSEIRDLVRAKSEELIGTAMEYYKAAQKDGYIRPEIRPGFLMWMLGQLVDMVGDEQLLRLYCSTEEMTSEVINFFLYGIMARRI